MIIIIIKITVILVMSTFLLITGIVAVCNSITFPPVWNTLLAGTFEHPLIAVSGGEVWLWKNRDLDGGFVLTPIMLVTAVEAVVFPVTFPVVEDTMTICTLELPVFTLFMFSAILEI